MHGFTRRSPALVLVAAAAMLLAPGEPPATAARDPLPADPLPSWNDTAPKKAIMAFVQKATRAGGPGFVPEPDRIAVFDNDGTLWAEKPLPFEVAFALDSIKAMASLHPEWKDEEPFASVLRGGREGLATVGEKGILKIIQTTHAGMTTDEFARRVETWIATAKHPDTGLPYTSMVYQPMLELLTYLRQHGFKTFIVSGGGVEFMRPWVEKAYGIPPWQVVGSAGKLKLEERKGVRPVLRKLPAIELIDDKEGKPVGIQSRIGRRPIAAFGNSDGDLQMLEWATAGEGTHFALLVHHDDARREYAYDRADPRQRLDKAWDVARRRGWTVVSIKNDWNTVFADVEVGSLPRTKAPKRLTASAPEP
jgi:phosphoserine phosphatase